MEEVYEHLKIIDYTLICLLNKYKIIHKYTNCISDIFLNTINEYTVIINNIQQKYKQHVYNSLNKNYLEYKESSTIQKEQDKKITEIKENLKKASKLTNTNVKFQENEEKKCLELNRELKIDLPYSVLALYKLRYYRNMFMKNYSTLTKNDNYLNACEQRRKFFEKLKMSASSQKNENGNEKTKKKSDIFADEDKNMIRILQENYFFKESQQLKEMLIISKYLNKAKTIINNVPQFLYNIIEEFELTESQFSENMYLFILLALNKWIKKIIIECENFITYRKNRVPVKGENENDIYKKYNEYMNDILQRGVEQTTIQFQEKPFFHFPSSLHFNINTSFLTYYFLYINKSLMDFVRGYYYIGSKSKSKSKNSGGSRQKDSFKKKKEIKMILLDKQEESVYMKHDIYTYEFQNELEEQNLFDNFKLGFEIEQEYLYPNIFLICNYLLQTETQKIIKEIYKLQRNGFRLMFYTDVSIVIQILVKLLRNLKQLFKKDFEKEGTEIGTGTGKEKEDEEEEEEAEEGKEAEVALNKLHKYISKANINNDQSTNYKKYLGPLRIMILTVLKLIHVFTKSSNRNTVCTFWQKMSIRDDISDEEIEDRTEKKETGELEAEAEAEAEKRAGEEKELEGENGTNFNPLRDCEKSTFKQLKKECAENNCYFLKTKEESKHNESHYYTHIVSMKEAINKRILCYDFHKTVADQIEKTKLELENKKNRDVFTGILKKKKYKLDSSRTKRVVGKPTSTEVKKIPVKSKTPFIPVSTSKTPQIATSKKEMSKEPVPLSFKTGSIAGKLKSEGSKILKTKKNITNINAYMNKNTNTNINTNTNTNTNIAEKKGNMKNVKSITGISENASLAKGISRATSSVKTGTTENRKQGTKKTGESFLSKGSSSLAPKKKNQQKI